MSNPALLAKLGSLYIVFLFISLAAAQGQISYYFYVQFSNKNNSSYSLSNPSQFLSARSIARREAFGLTCDSTDLPVNPTYLQQIRNLGIQVHNTSKWMNGATVLLADSGLMSRVRMLPFVKFVEYTGKLDGAVLAPNRKVIDNATFDYGIAATQINQLNGTALHNKGYRGKGIQIGVIDAGFTNVNTNSCFDSLRLQGRLLGTKDIVNPNSNIFAEDTHGAMVLATMTGNLPGQYLGTAPDASFWLIRTEYAATEYKVETDFWASGIEFADSVGVDLVNSSLGYYTFDDSIMNFTYADMNGKVSRASRAATMASRKGMLVVVSAGNEGNKNWHYIGSPADADGIVTVGAVTSTGTPSTFSSFGPSSDGRVKPDVCAMGTASAIVDVSGTPGYGNGTSFASPIMAGMMACLLQRYRALGTGLDITTLRNAVLESAGLFQHPTSQMGYGIPDFAKAEQNLLTFDSLARVEKSNFTVVYNPFSKVINFRFNDGIIPTGTLLQLYSMTGSLLARLPITDSTTVLKTDKLVSGIYAVCISENGKVQTKKIIIH
jgi:Subtilisin-like serine proteases